MIARLLLLIILIPVAELALLFYVGDHVGWSATVLLVIGTGVVGAMLARHQGMRAWRRVRDELGGRRVPADALLDGLLILIAGGMLITPGIITDVIGFSLLIPPVRNGIKARLTRMLRTQGGAKFRIFRSGGPAADRDSTIIDGEFTTEPPRNSDNAIEEHR